MVAIFSRLVDVDLQTRRVEHRKRGNAVPQYYRTNHIQMTIHHALPLNPYYRYHQGVIKKQRVCLAADPLGPAVQMSIDPQSDQGDTRVL